MGSHTRVAPWGKTISTRVATSKLRHLSVGRGSNALCANESLGTAAAAGKIALALRNARLSMSVLLSIEALSHNAGLGVPAGSAWNTRCRSLQEGLRGWGEGTAEEREASAEGRPPPSISPSGRHVPRAPPGCAKPILTASQLELRGQYLPFPRRRRGGVAIQEHREAHRDFLQELVDPRRALAEVHREDREGLAGKLVLQPLHRGHLLAAGIAPGGPEIDHHDLAAVVGELVLLALEIAQREGRRRAAAPGFQLAPGRPCRARAQDKPCERRQGEKDSRRVPRTQVASFLLLARTAKSSA